MLPVAGPWMTFLAPKIWYYVTLVLLNLVGGARKAQLGVARARPPRAAARAWDRKLGKLGTFFGILFS